jgi:hypothetical protein
VEGYLKALDDIPINEDIIRTDSEEDLNSKMKRYLIITPLTVFFCWKTTVAALKIGITKDIKFLKNSR